MTRPLTEFAKFVLPTSFARWYRRRRAMRRYMKALAWEVYERQARADPGELEGRIAARRDGFYDRLVREVLERNDLILQELDRRIEALSARHGTELRSLRDEVAALRRSVEELGAALAEAPDRSRAAARLD